jgi:UDP-glucuronate decarboxylase
MNYHHQNRLNSAIISILHTDEPNMNIRDGIVGSYFIVQALKGEKIVIFANGTQTRRCRYLDDLTQGMIWIMNIKNELLGPGNIVNSAEFTMLEIANKVLGSTGSFSRLIHLELPQDDPIQRKPVIDFPEKELNGWEPKVNLEEALVRTITYF